ncbi:MFS transporter [Streptomyces sp. SID3343]|uniref:MFS transporter n=1 Tax=Streptomyces sp. SID3343 TaxID=2690260 RepID=UPI00136A636A|nr:MFS transporter [Streptomyces sp. SID3343]MYW05578.1 MFS transporter [Streptomyces sp. SID3343]
MSHEAADPEQKTSGGPAHRAPATLWLVTVLLLAVGSYQLNNTMIAPANPLIIKELATDTAEVGLAQTLFLLVAAISAIIVTRISDWTGRRRALMFSLVALILGNIVSALAPDVGTYLTGRAVSGLCGAVFAFAFLILHDLLDLRSFSRALAVIAAVKAGLGGGEAVVSGAIVDNLGFRAVFWSMAAFTTVALVSVRLVIPETYSTTRQRLDWLGSLVIAVGLTGISLALSLGGKWGWGSPTTLIVFLAGVAALALFPLVEKRVRDPLIRTSELRSRNAWPVLLTNVLVLAGAFGATGFVLPLIAQDAGVGFGMGATTAALTYVMPVSLVGFAIAPIAGSIAPKVGWRSILVTGMVVTIAALAVLAAFSDDSAVAFAMALVLGAFYTGLVLTALDGLGVLLSSSEAPGALTGFNTAAFGIGASLGVAVTGGIITRYQSGGSPTPAGYATALWVCAGLALAGFLVAFFIPTTGVGAVDESTAAAPDHPEDPVSAADSPAKV